MTHPARATILPAPPEGVKWTSRSLSVLDPMLSFERFEELLRAAGEFKTATSFWIGDLINFGDARYGERYAQALDQSGLSYSTLSNYAYVCRQIAPSRRREGLRFSHHAEVAALEPAAQDEWLAKADQERWSREQLREAIKSAGQLPPPPPRIDGGGGSSRRQEVLDSPGVVEAARDLGVVREALTLTKDALEGATVEGLEEMLPGALRALDEVGKTVTAAAQKMAAPSLIDVCREVVKSSSRSSGFAMVPEETFERFRNALDLESR